jgi:acid phosphatase type 7
MLRRVWMAGLAALCLHADAQAGGKLVGGPVVVNAGKDTATVVYVYEDVENLRSEKVVLSKLQPGNVVYYDSRDGAKAWFTTAPETAKPFRFVVFGDTRTRHDLHQRVANAIVAAEPDFVLHTGDLVADGRQSSQWSTFFRIERELLRRTVFFPVVGNHERNSAQYFDFFDVKSSYYSFDWGNAHFVVLDTNGAVMKAEQTAWLENDLAASARAAFRFVIMHHPPYTVNHVKKNHVSAYAAELVPVFEKGKVTAVFAGHDHNYQRHVNNGITYIVTGGGGAPLAEAAEPLPGLTEKVVSTEHYVSVLVDGDKARVRAVALDGQEIETAELESSAKQIF